jgi:4'-phosphopantetheinyl transferase
MSAETSAPSQVSVWHATVADLISARPNRIAAGLALLRPHELDRYGRFRHDTDRLMFLLGRVMARVLVGRMLDVAPDAWPWCEGDRGRPEIAGSTTVSFNLAHSGGLVACAVSRDALVGVDLEDRARPQLAEALVARCCTADEARDIAQQGEAWRDRFLQYWTLKESYVKAVGLGIATSLTQVGFRLGPPPVPLFSGALAGADAGWTFELRTLSPAHFLAVAIRPHVPSAPVLTVQPFTESEWP